MFGCLLPAICHRWTTADVHWPSKSFLSTRFYQLCHCYFLFIFTLFYFCFVLFHSIFIVPFFPSFFTGCFIEILWCFDAWMLQCFPVFRTACRISCGVSLNSFGSLCLLLVETWSLAGIFLGEGGIVLGSFRILFVCLLRSCSGFFCQIAAWIRNWW